MLHIQGEVRSPPLNQVTDRVVKTLAQNKKFEAREDLFHFWWNSQSRHFPSDEAKDMRPCGEMLWLQGYNLQSPDDDDEDAA